MYDKTYDYFLESDRWEINGLFTGIFYTKMCNWQGLENLENAEVLLGRLYHCSSLRLASCQDPRQC